MASAAVNTIREGLMTGEIIAYLGPGMLTLSEEASRLPASLEMLAERLAAKVSVPHKIRNNVTAAAQFIENFKHRKTVTTVMAEAFGGDVSPTPLHRFLATISQTRLIVHAWYDDLPQKALAARDRFSIVQGVSQAEHFGEWVHYFKGGQTSRCELAEVAFVKPLLYQPLGSVSPANNFLVSDSDFVEVLTEIDIQTPIPMPVQNLRKGRSFLFLGCRFSSQLERIFARQIIKRSSDRHFAVLQGELTRNEARFLRELSIERIDMPLPAFAAELMGEVAPQRPRLVAG